MTDNFLTILPNLVAVQEVVAATTKDVEEMFTDFQGSIFFTENRSHAGVPAKIAG